MPSVEITPDGLSMSVPMKLSGNIGIGTDAPAFALDINGPASFNFDSNATKLFDTGSLGARVLSASADGNVVVIGKADNSKNFTLEYYTNVDGTFTLGSLSLQAVPNGVYSGGLPFYKSGSRGVISKDGSRILAVCGTNGYNPNANAAEVFHYESGSWISKAYLHHEGYFGYGYAISGDGNTIALTSPRENYNNFEGEIYVYKYNANTDSWDQCLSRTYENWPDQITLNNDGTLLAFSRTSFPPNQSREDPANAYVHILKYSNGAWNDGADDIIITAPNDLVMWHYYGKSIDFSADGKTLVVGAPGFGGYWINANTDTNRAYVYKSPTESWIAPTMSMLQPESYSSPTEDDLTNQFGNVVAVNDNGTVVVIGAQEADVDSYTNAGRAWVFQFVNNNWVITGTLDGDATNMRFGSALDITGDGYKLYVAARGVNNNPASFGVKEYVFLKMGTCMNATGNVQIKGQSSFDGDVYVSNGCVGIGTTIGLSPLHVVAPSAIIPYTSRPYEDYTIANAYANRTNLTFGDTDEGIATLPDFGFDFMINGVNYRNITKPCTNSYINFGNEVVTWSPDPSDFSTPVLFIGAMDYVIYSISYYAGTYNGNQAMYVFFDGHEWRNEPNVNQWCAILQSNGQITIHMKQVENDSGMLFGLWDGTAWIAELPENNSSTWRYDFAYDLLAQAYGDSALIYGNVGIGTSAPLAALDVVGNVKATKFVGDGSLLTNVSIEPWVSPNQNTAYILNANVGIGNSSPTEVLDVTGNVKATNFIGDGSQLTNVSAGAPAATAIATFTKNLSTTVNDWTEFANIASWNGGMTIHIDLTQTEGGSSISKSYIISRNYYYSQGNWQLCNPITTSGDYEGNDWRLEMQSNFGSVSFRVVRVGGQGNNLNVTAIFRATASVGAYAPVITELNDTGSDASYNGFYHGALLTQCKGNVGIGVSAPSTTLDVGGDVTCQNITISPILSLNNPAVFTAQTVGNSPASEFDFGEPVVLQYYTLQGAANSGFWGRQPLDFEIQGSTNNSTFVTLDTRTDIDWGNLGVQRFTPSQITTAYRYYRMVPTRLYDNSLEILYPDIWMYAPSSASKTVIVNNGNVGIGTTPAGATLTVNGTIRNINGPSPTSGTSLVITASGDIAPQSSDARYKTNVQDMPSVLDKLMDVRAVSYNWKEEPQVWYGLLAQQVSEVFPEAAWHNADDDTYGVHYTPSIVTLVLKAMQEMKQTYDQRLASLQQDLDLLKAQNQ